MLNRFRLDYNLLAPIICHMLPVCIVYIMWYSAKEELTLIFMHKSVKGRSSKITIYRICVAGFLNRPISNRSYSVLGLVVQQ